MADWVKLHTDLLDNPDVSEISPLDYMVFTFLLMLARREDCANGVLAGWSHKRLAYRFRQTEEQIGASLQVLSDVGWLGFDDNSVTITNYKARQYDKPSDQPEATRDRQRKRRDTESCHAPVTPLSRPCHATEERRGEENRVEEIEKAEPPPPPVAPLDPQFGELVKLLESERIVTTYSKTLMDDVGDVWDDHPKLDDWKAAILRVKARDPARGNWALLKVIMLDFMRTGSWDKPGGNGHGPPGKRPASRETDYSKIQASAPIEPYVPMTPEEKATRERELAAMGLL